MRHSGFTGLTERLGAKTIVHVMHGLWSCFDALVQKHSMFKMDTVRAGFAVYGFRGEGVGGRESARP